jgi:hypothetical protein
MDKTSRVKELVVSSLNSSFGGGIIVKEMIVLPTQKFNEKTSGWDPDSFAVFLSIEDKRTDQPDFYHFVSDDPRVKISSFLESLLGFEVCVDIV